MSHREQEERESSSTPPELLQPTVLLSSASLSSLPRLPLLANASCCSGGGEQRVWRSGPRRGLGKGRPCENVVVV